MKKLAIILTAAMCCITLLTACSSKKNGTITQPVTMKDGQTVHTIVDQIAKDVGVAMPADVDENVLRDLCGIPPEDAQAYAGKIAIVNTSSDNVIAVHAKEGKIDSVKAALDKRLTDVQKSFEMYLPEQYDKAQKGQVMVKGDYAFLLIVGESGETMEADMEKAVKIINDAFVA